MAFELRQDSDGGYRMFPKETGCGCSCSTIIVIFILLCIVGMCNDSKSTTSNSNEPKQFNESVKSETEDNVEEAEDMTPSPPINWEDYYNNHETDNDEQTHTVTNDNVSRQQDVIVEDVNNNSNHYQPDNPRDNDRVQQEPEDVDENINQYNTNNNQDNNNIGTSAESQISHQSAISKGEKKEKALFSTDDIVSTKQVGNYKEFLLKDGRIVRYDRTTGKNTIIQRVDRKTTTKTYFEDEIYSDQ